MAQMIGDVEIRLMTPADAEQFKQVLCHYWTTEPTAVALDINVPCDIGEAVFDKYVTRFCGDGRSFCAMDTPTGVMAGFHLSASVKKNDPQMKNFTKAGYDMSVMTKFQCYMLGSQVVHKDINVFERYGVDTMLHCEGLGVLPQYQCRGLAKALVKTSIANARRQGFKLICCESSNDFSRRCFDQLGFEFVTALTFEQFKELGFPFIKDTGQHTKQTVHCLPMLSD